MYICEIIFFSKFCGIIFVFFLFFYYFWLFLFNFVNLYLSKSSGNFYVFFILLIRDFIKDFLKIMEHFSKKYRHLKSIILHKFHCLLFVFFFLVFLISLFLFYKSLVFKKFLKFLWFYCMESIFYQKILQNYGFFWKKIEIFEIQNFNKISSFPFDFLFFRMSNIFFSISPVRTCQKIIEFFCSILFEGLEILSTNSRNF